MQPIVVSDILAVGEVPSLEQIEILAKAGFKSVINNQPDGEVERLPGSDAIAREAARRGLGHAFVPIASRTPDEAQLAAFAHALASLPAPIYAFCYSGSRSAAATALLLMSEREPASVITEFGAAGYDIAALAPWLAERRAKVAARSGNGNGAPDPGEKRTERAAAMPEREIAPAAAQRALQGIVVHARPRGAGGFAM